MAQDRAASTRRHPAWDAMVEDGRAQLAAEGFTGAAAQCRREAGLHYHGQTFDLVIPAPEGPLDGAALAALAEAFGQEHERTYGHRAGPEEPVELVSIKVVARGLGEREKAPTRPAGDGAVPAQPRRAWFGPAAGWLETPVLSRAELATPRIGPCIVEEYDATTLVPPGMSARLDAFGNIVIALTGSQSSAAPVLRPGTCSDVDKTERLAECIP